MKDITISRRSLLVSAGLLALAPLAGCGGNSGSGSAAAGSDYTIGVLQLTEHSALDAANDGFVKAIKSQVSVPIIAVNTVKHPQFAEQLLQEGVSDFVGMSRMHIADPYLVQKAMAGREDLIRKCHIIINALSLCTDSLFLKILKDLLHRYYPMLPCFPQHFFKVQDLRLLIV